MKDNKSRYSSRRLQVFLPDAAHPKVVKLLKRYNVRLRLTPHRATKMGDYFYCPQEGHKISVNKTLNPYGFLITLIHELAHLKVYTKHGNKVAPHGKEWKQIFKKMMVPFLEANVFPHEIAEALSNYLKNPAASSCVDKNLMRVLKRYDKDDNTLFIEDLPRNAVFKTSTGRTFIKGPQLRKRFKCKEISTDKLYLFNPVAEVQPVDGEGAS